MSFWPASSPHDAPRTAETGRTNHRFIASALLCLLLLFLAVASLAKPLNHDEEQFVASGVLLARNGLFPYLDYPYFHLPNLVFAFAALFSASDFLLLTARSFNILCAGLLLLLVFAIALSAFRFLGEKRWSIALALTLLLALNPIFRLTTGRAWNHDLAILASVAAFAALLRALRPASAAKWLAVSGALLGLAIGTRLTFLPLVAPFVGLTLMFPTAETSRLRGAMFFLAALTLALLPTIILWVAGPQKFFFDNFLVNGPLNLRFRHAEVPDENFLQAKLLFPFKRLLVRSPSNLLLGVGFGIFACWFPSRAGWHKLLHTPESAAVRNCSPLSLWQC